MTNRLGDWAGQFYGSLALPYELNSQESHRHLNLDGIRGIGKQMVLSATKVFASDNGSRFYATTRQFLARRSVRQTKFADAIEDNRNPFQAEIRYQLGIGKDVPVQNVELIH